MRLVLDEMRRRRKRAVFLDRRFLISLKRKSGRVSWSGTQSNATEIGSKAVERVIHSVCKGVVAYVALEDSRLWAVAVPNHISANNRKSIALTSEFFTPGSIRRRMRPVVRWERPIAITVRLCHRRMRPVVKWERSLAIAVRLCPFP